jgi:MFS transporter, FSR family, fosmidomycin resistance protein
MTADSARSRDARSHQRRALGVACGAHALHDGYTDLIYVLLPVWQAEFGLGYTEVGLLRGAFAGAMAALQVPAGLVAERAGVGIVLAAGTAVTAIAFLVAGAVSGFATLLAVLLVGGVGASVQHPVASAVVARAFTGARSRIALGNYNFAGDIGKMTLPVATALLLTVMQWRAALVLLAALGLAAALAIALAAPASAAAPAPAKSRHDKAAPSAQGRGFPLLLSIGALDSATRMAFLTFLPFILLAKGASIALVGIALTLVFAGGAVGKLVCARLGVWFGVLPTVILTEALTAAGIAALLPLPLWIGLPLLPMIGIALNGTSSVLYGTVPELVPPDRHARAFGVFYTATIGSGAVAPAVYGLVSDAYGVPTTMLLIAAVVLTTLPLALALRRALPPAST